MKSFMDQAYLQAKKAYMDGEIPIGAVIVKDGKVIARGYNRREKTQIATKHAEVVAIERACKKLNSWRLDGCEMYVTVEPCLMCFGAILNARLDAVYFGAEDFNGGAGKFTAILSADGAKTDGSLGQSSAKSDGGAGDEKAKAFLNWNTRFVKADGEERCSDLLKSFFSERRKGITVNKRSRKHSD